MIGVGIARRMSESRSWLELTADDRDGVCRALDLRDQQGTLDEVRLGNLRDVISSTLLPGKSLGHTRLLNMPLIPSIYQELELRGGARQRLEIALTENDHMSMLELIAMRNHNIM